jgi:hypothetical protein
MAAATSKFQVGQIISARSACDWECIFEWEVIARTEKMMTVKYHGETKRVGIKVRNGVETAQPFGSYSMSPMVFADRQVA